MKSIIVALIFNGLDLLSGIIAAVKEKNLKSSALRDGLFKKVGFITCYLLAWLIDEYGKSVGIPIDIPILPVIIGYVCVTEAVSIIENVCRMNPDLIPEKIIELFNIGKEGGDNAGH